MKKEEIIKKLESDKGDTDYILRSQDEEKTFLENHKADVLEKELDPAVAKIHTQYDEDLFSLFGTRKKPGEKTYKFMKDQFNTLKDKADKVDQLESEIAKLKDGNPDDAKRLKEIKDLQDQLRKLKEDHDAELTKIAKQNLKSNVRSEIERAYMNLKIKPGIPDSMKQVYLDTIINELSENAEVREGKTVFLDKDGKALRDNATMAPYTAEALLRERMKDVIDTGRKQEGPGIGEKIEMNEKGAPIITRPTHITTRQALGDYLVKDLGIKRNTEEFRKAYEEYGKDLPVYDTKK
jgi:hypothetical protein